MNERYDVAAGRHQRVAEHLEGKGEFDDAGYHYGVAGENAVKNALRDSGVEAAWTKACRRLRETPMGRHFPTLQDKVKDVQTEIQAFACGRLATSIQKEILGPDFPSRYQGWNLDIRYADRRYTPVDPKDCARWAQDTAELLVALI